MPRPAADAGQPYPMRHSEAAFDGIRALDAGVEDIGPSDVVAVA
jgi:hypothetical protein